jgi:hypothetical protein
MAYLHTCAYKLGDSTLGCLWAQTRDEISNDPANILKTLDLYIAIRTKVGDGVSNDEIDPD